LVDELRKEQAQFIEDIAYMAANEATVQRERDELRAKLAEADREIAVVSQKLSVQRTLTEAAEVVAEERRERAKKAELALEAAEAGLLDARLRIDEMAARKGDVR
jgi:hypothetical protein